MEFSVLCVDVEISALMSGDHVYWMAILKISRILKTAYQKWNPILNFVHAPFLKQELKWQVSERKGVPVPR